MDRETRGLERLHWKYQQLVLLRARREEVEASGGAAFGAAEARERKRLFRRVAREFPGALRELDTLSAAQLQARADRVAEALARLESDEAPTDPWIGLILDFHQSLREALMLKRWLARRLPREETIPPAVVEEFTKQVDRSRRLQGRRRGGWQRLLSSGPHALLARHHRPRGGGVLGQVWEALESRHGRTRADLEPLIFGASR